MGLIKIVHEDNSSLNNFDFDFLQLVRFSLGLALTSNEIGVNAYNVDRDLFIHVEDDIEPPDGDVPFDAYVFWMETIGLNKRMMAKHKDAGGVVRTRNMGLFT